MPILLSSLGFKFLLFLGLLPLLAGAHRWVVRSSHCHFVLAYLLGSGIAAVLITFAETLSLPWFESNPFLVALGIVGMVLLWKFLFGPWGAPMKVTVLGTFLFWVAVHLLLGQSPTERLATLLATLIALLPAILWCLLFLHEHRERLSVVLLTFFAGMLSTAPILFYDSVVRRGLELHFFLFRITPESFHSSSETFVTQSLTGEVGIVSTSALVTIVSFVLVGVIEEWSKHWVIRKGDRAAFTSIDDVIELSIIAAIGFAFAENVINPSYFLAFVQDYLVEPDAPQWAPFLGSVFGRSLITNMVHIISSGVLGYYYGLAFFAEPLLLDARAQGHRRFLTTLLHRLLQVPRATLFRDMKMVQGLTGAILLHSLFDILVSIPEILPGNPATLGELLGYGGPLSHLSLVVVPSFLYVFGGWFLLRSLFRKRQDMKEYGHRIQREGFVPDLLPT